MEKVKIYLGLELVFGPILKNNQLEDGSFSSGSQIVDNDEILNALDKEVNELWSSLYHKDNSSPSGVKFDSDQEKKLAPRILLLINQIIDRLNKINDGTFEIEDMITDYLKKLI